MTLDKNDPRLTAFVLGELSEDEARRVQEEIEADEALLGEAGEIRSLATSLKDALAAEPLPEMTDRPMPAKPHAKRSWARPLIATAVMAPIAVIAAALLWPTDDPTRELANEIAMAEASMASPVADRLATEGELQHPGELETDEALDLSVDFSASELLEVSDPITPPFGVPEYAVETSHSDLVAQPGFALSGRNESDYGGSYAGDGRGYGASGSAAGGYGSSAYGDSYGESNGYGEDYGAPKPAANVPGNSLATMPASSTPGVDPGVLGQVNGSASEADDTWSQVRNRASFSQQMRGGSPHELYERHNAEKQEIAVGRESQSLQMMVTPRIVIQEGEEERLVLSNTPRDESMAGWRVPDARQRSEYGGAEAYAATVENAFQSTIESPLSTFSIDVDTAGYSNVRRFLDSGMLPPPAAVRIEEMVNYFSYDYAEPEDEVPFAARAEVGPCPWNPDHLLAKIGLKGREIHKKKDRPALNLVFLIDVSGSMSASNKLPLVKHGLAMLVESLTRKDHVAIVVYAGSSGLVLEPTRGDHTQVILDAIGRLQSGGSTAGAQGIRQAYNVAKDHFDEEAMNRVVLCTDGDFNVGVTDNGELEELIAKEAKSGVFLTTLGFGRGNLKDDRLEMLADKGNGNYGYIDTEAEARKMLVEDLSGTLVTIAKDVKIQIDFNPANVKAYRLIGYENRVMAAKDFHDDTKDAGEIGAGHTVTALYEIVPPGVAIHRPETNVSKYQRVVEDEPEEEYVVDESLADELFTLKLRYKLPREDESSLLEYPVNRPDGSVHMSGDFQFASSVALFGMLLRESQYAGGGTLDTVLELAQGGLGEDEGGYRKEFVELVRKAQGMGR